MYFSKKKYSFNFLNSSIEIEDLEFTKTTLSYFKNKVIHNIQLHQKNKKSKNFEAISF